MSAALARAMLALRLGQPVQEDDGDPETFWRVYSDHTRAQDVTDHALALLP
ncbi:hypothetical protein [Streptomyces sp. NPDC059063]|uniref:hypothetical protein n=1 Tax=Streptomyces sp. NPDC059063 TaxID=3346712 RepID=UPI00367E90E9